MMKNFIMNLKVLLIFFLLAPTISTICQDELSMSEIDSILKDYILIEGDILIHKDLYGTDACYATNFWTYGIVPFEFNPNVSETNQASAISAMEEWEAVADIDFIPRNGHSNYIHIFSADGNFSSGIGMTGGRQLIGIYNWGRKFIIAHELCHALGFWHEQSRANRDLFIQVNEHCIIDSMFHNFQKHSGAGHYGYYDFMSVMHYDDMAFYENTNPDPRCTEPYSITVLPPNQAYQNLIGQRNNLSYLDQITMSFVYPEDDWWFVDMTHGGTESGTFLEPFQTFLMGALVIPPGGTLWVQPGPYVGAGTYSKEMTIKAPLGGVLLQ